MDNLFKTYNAGKQEVLRAVQIALQSDIIDQETYDSLVDKVQSDVLTIGVIGQMKCGKSTFLNAMLFGAPLLPAATTPMTAALTTLTYGDETGITVEFYTPDEWQQIEATAALPYDDAKIKAARQLVEKSHALGSERQALLGTTANDSIERLKDYVGANGPYVALTKSVTVTMPDQWLRGVQIVDTPGFNDPVASREQRTSDFLSQADAVLLMLYAGRPFDSTDRDILFDKLRSVGIEKVVLAVNKYDLQIAQGESPRQISDIVIDELNKASAQLDIPVDLSELSPILVSALMGLLGRMPMTQIVRDANLYHHYKHYCETFDLDSQAQMLQMSNMSELEQRLTEVVTHHKQQILITRPLAMIRQRALSAIDDIRQQSLTLNHLRDELSMPDQELENRLANLTRAQRRIERTVANAEDELGISFDEISAKLFREVQDRADSVKWECDRLIETYKRSALERKLADRINRFRDREFPRMIEDITRKLRRALDHNINQLISDIESILSKHVDDAEEITNHFRSVLRHSLDIEQGTYIIEHPDEPELADTESEDTPAQGFQWWRLAQLVVMIPLYPINGICDLLDTGRDEARITLDDFFGSIDWHGMQQMMQQLKHQFIQALGGDTVKSLISQLVQQAAQVQTAKDDKAVILKDLEQQIASLSSRLGTLETALSQIPKA